MLSSSPPKISTHYSRRQLKLPSRAPRPSNFLAPCILPADPDPLPQVPLPSPIVPAASDAPPKDALEVRPLRSYISSGALPLCA